MKSRAGFTLIELIIFTAIFALAMGAFMSVFTDVSRVAVRQSSTTEVQSQSQFLLQTIQHYVERSSLVDMTVDSSTSTLELYMSSTTEDRATIGLVGTAVQLTTKSGTPQAVTSTITSSKVEVSSLSFTRRSNPGSKDSVAVAFTIVYSTGNSTLRFAQSLQTSVARVSAATFDSDIVPDTNNTYQLGTSPNAWHSINNTLFFNGSNVGIGTENPGYPLHVNGIIRTNDDIYISDAAAGLILNDGTGCWRLAVNGSGVLSTATATCP